jgi:pimeloyl-ACP methyl ester carboxylesterase
MRSTVQWPRHPIAGSAETMEKLVCFAHGMESGPWGTKITHLAGIARQQGYSVLSPDYSHTRDPHRRVAQLLELAPGASRALVLVGSSMGGYVSAAACAQLRPQALFLMAPALYFPGFEAEPDGIPALCSVVHGWRDDVVPVSRALRFAERNRAALHVLDSAHDLNDQLPAIGALFAQLLQHAESARDQRRQ